MFIKVTHNVIVLNKKYGGSFINVQMDLWPFCGMAWTFPIPLQVTFTAQTNVWKRPTDIHNFHMQPTYIYLFNFELLQQIYHYVLISFFIMFD